MKNTKKAAATGSEVTYMFPIDKEEVTARLNAFKFTSKKTDVDGMKCWRVESARRDAWYKIKEATIQLAIAKAEGTAESSNLGKQELDFRTTRTCRHIGQVIDDVALAAEVLEKALALSEPVESLKSEAAALLPKISKLQARKVEVLHGLRKRLKDELKAVTAVSNNGEWRKVEKGDRAETLEHELNSINPLLHGATYGGVATEDGLKRRIDEIHQKMEEINEGERKSLNQEEEEELAAALIKHREITNHLNQIFAKGERKESDAADALAEFNERFEAALIEADGLVEVYRIQCELLAIRHLAETNQSP